MFTSEYSRCFVNKYITNLGAASLSLRIYIIVEIYSIVFGYIWFLKSRDLNIELLTISTDNIWKLCGLELKGIQSLRLIFFYIASCQYSMLYTNCS